MIPIGSPSRLIDPEYAADLRARLLAAIGDNRHLYSHLRSVVGSRQTLTRMMTENHTCQAAIAGRIENWLADRAAGIPVPLPAPRGQRPGIGGPRTVDAETAARFQARLLAAVGTDKQLYRDLVRFSGVTSKTIDRIMRGEGGFRRQLAAVLEQWLLDREAGLPIEPKQPQQKTQQPTESLAPVEYAGPHPALERASLLSISAIELANMIDADVDEVALVMAGDPITPALHKALDHWMTRAVVPDGDGGFVVI